MTHYGRVYDNHTGMDFPMNTGSAVVAARDGTVVDVVESFPSTPGQFGNYVLVQHADGKRTLYYHLANLGVSAVPGQKVFAGQRIATSGCSGDCYGAHLHFELLVPNEAGWKPTDPHAERRWTTWPARVPYLASYVRELNPNTVVLRQGQTLTQWVEFRNDGGRTWRNNIGTHRLILGTWAPATRSSAFRAADWPSSWVATNVDALSVPPGGVGRFTFGLRGGAWPGFYDEQFNLLANSVAWFDHARIGYYHVPIRVTNLTP